MGAFDCVIFGIVGLSSFVGLYKGIVRISIGFVAFLCSVFLSYELIPFIAPFIQEHVSSNVIATVATYVSSYVVAAIFCGIVARVIIKVVGPISGGIIDRMLGLIFGAARGLFAALIGFMIIAVVASGSYSQARNSHDLFTGLKEDKYPNWFKDSSLFEKLDLLFHGAINIIPKDMMLSEFPGIPKLPTNTITFGEDAVKVVKDQVAD